MRIAVEEALLEEHGAVEGADPPRHVARRVKQVQDGHWKVVWPREYAAPGAKLRVYDGDRSDNITYTNLDPGRYTFRLRAANADGVWNENGLAVDGVLPDLFQVSGGREQYRGYVVEDIRADLARGLEGG